MINYINAELYRISHKKSNLIYFGVIFLLIIVSFFFTASTDLKNDDMLNLVTVLTSLLPIFAGIPIFLTVYNDDLSAKSLSNVVSTGLTKTKLPIAKFIVATIYTTILFIIATIVYFIIYFIALGSFADLGSTELNFIFLSALIRYLSCLGFFAMTGIIAYAFQKSSITIVALITIIVGAANQMLLLLPYINSNLKLISNNTLTSYVSSASSSLMDGGTVSSNLYIAVAIYIIVSLVLTTFIISKRDIEVG